MTFAQILPQVANGLVLGSMYALVAIGFSLVLGSLHRLNLAHPEMFMLGGFVALVGSQYGLPAWLGGLAAFGVGGVAGLMVERISFRGGIGGDAEDVAALSSVAVGVVLVDLVQKIWGTEPVPLVETAATAGIGLTELEEALLLQVQAMGGNCLLVIPLTINIISAQLIVILMTEFFK